MKRMNKKAFTLIELLVVIAVIGILVLLGAPRFTGYTQKAELTRIQHDIKVMEQEVGTVLINKDDDFNNWGNNSKDFNQLIQEGKLFEKEGFVVDDVESIDGPYKVIPEEYKDKINTKLKGTFYANSGGKVYYEHLKALSGIPTEPEEKEPGVPVDPEKPAEPVEEETVEKEPVYSDEEIKGLIEEGYIPIATAEELAYLNESKDQIFGEGTKWKGEYTSGLDKKYIVVADIDLSKFGNFEPIGKSDSEFKGTFDGGGYVISNLTISRVSEDNVGLFGRAEGATFKNIGLVDVNVTGGNRTGGLVGRQESSKVLNSYSTGTVKGTGDFVGGLVGNQTSSSISDSYATGKVNGTGRYVGGLVGDQDSSSEVLNSYATGTVTGGSNVGGLVGSQWGSTVLNSYAEGTVTGGDYTGGLVGRQFGSSVVSNSYYDKDTTGRSDIGKGTGKTTKEMQDKDTYANWNFESVWEIDEGNDYPKLR